MPRRFESVGSRPGYSGRVKGTEMRTSEQIRHEYALAAVEDLCGAVDALNRAWIGDPAEHVGAHEMDTLRQVERLRDDAERLMVRAALLAEDLESLAQG